MRRNQLNLDLKETTHSKFSLMGYFSLDSDLKDILRGSVGIFNYKDGVVNIEMTPHIFQKKTNHHGGHSQVKNYKDGIIFGILEDGTFVRLNKFYDKNWVAHIPGFATINYIATDIDFSRKEFTKNDLLSCNYIIITIDSLSQLAAFVVDNEPLKSKSKSIKIGETSDFEVYLSSARKKIGNEVDYEVHNDVELKLRVKHFNLFTYNFLTKFANFISIVNNNQMNITSVRYLDKREHTCLLHLYNSNFTKRNGKINYSGVIDSAKG